MEFEASGCGVVVNSAPETKFTENLDYIVWRLFWLPRRFDDDMHYHRKHSLLLMSFNISGKIEMTAKNKIIVSILVSTTIVINLQKILPIGDSLHSQRATKYDKFEAELPPTSILNHFLPWTTWTLLQLAMKNEWVVRLFFVKMRSSNIVTVTQSNEIQVLMIKLVNVFFPQICSKHQVKSTNKWWKSESPLFWIWRYSLANIL